MKESVKLTFKGMPQEKRRKLLKALQTIGLTEISSQHDHVTDKHIYEMHLDGDLTEMVAFEVIDEPYFRVEAGVGC